jgi:hypothetical protein
MRDTVVLVSGFGDDGRGGVFTVAEDGVEILDSLPTVGLAVGDKQLARLLRAPGELTGTTELLVYDTRGIVEYRRLDAVRDPHDVLADGDGWLVVSTGTNEIVRVDARGALDSIWHGGGEADAWHVNCLACAGELYASAFGEFATFKQWRGKRAVGRGRVWNIATGEIVLEGLTHPHTPRCVDGGWIVCESLGGAVSRFDARGKRTDEVILGGYSRGLAVAGEHLLVGVSAPRDDRTASAHLVWLDRTSLVEQERVALPCREIYDVVAAEPVYADAIRTGFATNPYRVGTLLAAQWKAADRAADACTIRAALPAERAAGDRFTIAVEIENTGSSWLGSVDPQPVFVASRWIDGDGTQVDGDRMALPVVLAPGQRTLVALPISAPAPGDYELNIALVREGLYWLDGASARVEVRTRAPNC